MHVIVIFTMTLLNGGVIQATWSIFFKVNLAAHS